MGNREALLDAARTCLVDKGYGATSVRDLASTAGVSMAAIGYHFGSREALLNIALFDLLDRWGAELARAHAGSTDHEARWAAMIESFTADRTLFLASVEAAVLAAHTPALREQLAHGLQQARRGLGAAVVGVDEDALDEHAARTVGAIQLALVSGVLLQWLTDPDRAPSSRDVVAGLRALADRLDHP